LDKQKIPEERRMATARSSSNKAKIARRVIEVLEFFDDAHPEATVMDIVRRYNRPQSSTSELLSSLVELGLLNKDPYSRSYRLTARAALLGSTGQSDMARDGRLVRLMDRLVAQTGLTVALFGKVELDGQIVSLRRGHRDTRDAAELFGGMKEPLARNAAGWLMLSTIDKLRRDSAVRRLNAEADDAHKFGHAQMMDCITQCGERRYAFGPAGYDLDSDIVAVLVPRQPDGHPLVIGIIHERGGKVNQDSLLDCIGDAMRQCLPDPEMASIEKLQTAA
jgi:DNA-binding IclR family transcriptional regulator